MDEVCTRLEKSKNIEADVKKIIAENYSEHKRIVFNGNNYSREWQEEAKRRGLLNLKTTPEALPNYTRPENVAMFEKHKVYTEQELKARQEILLENYCKIINIEALTMLSMVTKEILPACFKYENELADTAAKKTALKIGAATETEILTRISALTDAAYKSKTKLEEAIVAAKAVTPVTDAAKFYQENVFMSMQELRTSCDELETLVAKKLWPFPTYSDILFSI